MKQTMNPQEVMALLGVSNDTLRAWRRPQRLPLGADDPHYLPATPDPTNKNVVWYDTQTVLAFVQRHERYREHVLAAFAPDHLRQAFTPQSQPA